MYLKYIGLVYNECLFTQSKEPKKDSEEVIATKFRIPDLNVFFQSAPLRKMPQNRKIFYIHLFIGERNKIDFNFIFLQQYKI
jgi:hypothetical protein